MSESDLSANVPSPENDEPSADEAIPLPPPSFDFFVLSMKAQAEMAMGMFHFGDEADRPKPDLRVARHSIDLLAMIADKTKGNLSTDEQRLIENSLTELRFRYIQAVESAGKQHS